VRKESALPPAGGRFDVASAAVVDYLVRAVPFGFWSVTRYDGERQVYLTATGEFGGVSVGDATDWDQTMCQHAVAGVAPDVAPDVRAVPAYAQNELGKQLGVAAYVGVPIRYGDAQVFGTLCGMDPDPQPDSFAEHRPMLQMLCTLLSLVLEADLEQYAAESAARIAAAHAQTDIMTGVLNRRGWERCLAIEVERARRFGDPCALFVLDLDGLKQINDSLGHTAGDDYIRRAADALRSVVRDGDVVARLGGDEFGIIASRTGIAAAARLQRRVSAALGAAGVACSIGRAQLSIKVGAAASCHQADADMYANKRLRKSAALVGAG
jgi:diguanylate cyclase (GGDEF)-like protein